MILCLLCLCTALSVSWSRQQTFILQSGIWLNQQDVCVASSEVCMCVCMRVCVCVHLQSKLTGECVDLVCARG